MPASHDPGGPRRTFPSDFSEDDTQPTPPQVVYPPPPPPPPPPPLPPRTPAGKVRRPRRRRRISSGCLSFLIALAILAAIYLLLPIRTNVLILGSDSRDPATSLGRTDTMILASIVPLNPDVSMLSLPRDLWVSIPGYGENRINAAYFFGEAEQPPRGMPVAVATIEESFGVRMDHYVIVKFIGIVSVVDAMGGIEIDLPRAMSGYDAGVQRMDGTQALAFVRDRSGSDDFFRMERGQLFIQAMVRAYSNPVTWLRLPFVAAALPASLETDLPPWQWPRLGLALLRAGPDGIDSRALDRTQAMPFTTASGANVLLPNWELIRPVVDELFR